MPLSKNINNYADVRAILDQLLPHGGGVYRLPNEGTARHWQMRAYQFRRLEQELGRQRASVKGYTPTTPYDMMRLTLTGRSVKVEFMPQPVGEISLPTGEVIKPALPSTPVEKVTSENGELRLKTTQQGPLVPPALIDLAEGLAQLIEEKGDDED